MIYPDYLTELSSWLRSRTQFIDCIQVNCLQALEQTFDNTRQVVNTYQYRACSSTLTKLSNKALILQLVCFHFQHSALVCFSIVVVQTGEMITFLKCIQVGTFHMRKEVYTRQYVLFLGEGRYSNYNSTYQVAHILLHSSLVKSRHLT